MQFQSQCVQNKQIVTDPAVCKMNVCLCKQWVLFPGKGLLTKDTNKFEFEFDYWCELGFVMNRL